MSRTVRNIFMIVAVLACVCSCSRGGKVIPRSKMAKIYADMFIIDSWMTIAPYESRRAVDTLNVYEPVFNDYGYSTEDYRTSVSYYLQDPDRFSRILRKTGNILKSDMEELIHEQDARIEQEKLRRQYRNSIRKYEFTVYDTLFDKASFTDRIEIKKDAYGRFLPVRVLEDTCFYGPKLILQNDVDEVKVAVLEMEAPVL